MSPSLSMLVLQRQSDERLLAAASAGARRPFEALVQRYRRPLLAYCKRLGLPEARAEDVVQQALMQAWASLQRGAEVKDASAWLYRIVHNVGVDTLRARDHLHEHLTEAFTELPAVASDPERAVAMRDTLAGLAALPQLQRDALLFTAVQGRSSEQAAQALGVSDNALRGLVYRARVTLRAAAMALSPGPLVAWISACGRRVSALAGRLGSLGPAGGAQGELPGVLLKGGAAVLAAGAIVAGAGTIRQPHGSHRHGSAATQAGGLASAGPIDPSLRPAARRTAATGPTSGAGVGSGGHRPSALALGGGAAGVSPSGGVGSPVPAGEPEHMPPSSTQQGTAPQPSSLSDGSSAHQSAPVTAATGAASSSSSAGGGEQLSQGSAGNAPPLASGSPQPEAPTGSEAGDDGSGDTPGKGEIAETKDTGEQEDSGEAGSSEPGSSGSSPGDPGSSDDATSGDEHRGRERNASEGALAERD